MKYGLGGLAKGLFTGRAEHTAGRSPGHFSTDREEIERMRREAELAKKSAYVRLVIMSVMLAGILASIMYFYWSAKKSDKSNSITPRDRTPNGPPRTQKNLPRDPLFERSGFTKDFRRTESLHDTAARKDFAQIDDGDMASETGLKLSTDIEAAQPAINRIFNYLRTKASLNKPLAPDPAAAPPAALQHPAAARGKPATLTGGYSSSNLSRKFESLAWDDAAFDCGVDTVSLLVLNTDTKSLPRMDPNTPVLRNWRGRVGIILPTSDPMLKIIEYVGKVNRRPSGASDGSIPMNVGVEGYPIRATGVFLQRYAYRDANREWRVIPLYVAVKAADASRPADENNSNDALAAEADGGKALEDFSRPPPDLSSTASGKKSGQTLYLPPLTGEEKFDPSTTTISYTDWDLTDLKRAILKKRYGFIPLANITGNEDEFFEFDDRFRGDVDFRRVNNPKGGATAMFLLFRFLRSHTDGAIRAYQKRRENEHKTPGRQRATYTNVLDHVQRPNSRETYRGQPAQLHGVLRRLDGPYYWDTNPDNDSGIRTTFMLTCQYSDERQNAFVLVTSQNFMKIIQDYYTRQKMDPRDIDYKNLNIEIIGTGLFFRQMVYTNNMNTVVHVPMFVSMNVKVVEPVQESTSIWGWLALVFFIVLLALMFVGIRRESARAREAAQLHKKRFIARSRREGMHFDENETADVDSDADNTDTDTNEAGGADVETNNNAVDPDKAAGTDAGTDTGTETTGEPDAGAK